LWIVPKLLIVGLKFKGAQGSESRADELKTGQGTVNMVTMFLDGKVILFNGPSMLAVPMTVVPSCYHNPQRPLSNVQFRKP